MKFKSLLLGSILISAGASAQITIQGSSLNGWMPSLDSMYAVSDFVATASPNGNWDLTTASYSSSGYMILDSAGTHPSFPDAQYKRKMAYVFSSSLGYLATQYWGKDNDGIYVYGEQIERQAYSLAALTGDTDDSLVFNEQTVVFSNPRQSVAFPMSYGNHWSSEHEQNTDFAITVTAYGMVGTPGSRRTAITQIDTVKGWGQMRVKNAAGNNSGYMDVLAVKRREYYVDSFFLMGQPAPAQMLAAFGLSQGMSSDRYSVLFFRSGEVTPLLTIEYTDSTFSNVDYAELNRSRLAPGTNSIEGVYEGERITVYPNPVVNGRLNIGNLASESDWSYQITSMTGQQISSGKLSVGSAEINLQNVASGAYNLTILKDGANQGSNLIVVQ